MICYAVIDTNVLAPKKHFPIEPFIVTPGELLEILNRQ